MSACPFKAKRLGTLLIILSIKYDIPHNLLVANDANDFKSRVHKGRGDTTITVCRENSTRSIQNPWRCPLKGTGTSLSSWSGHVDVSMRGLAPAGSSY